MKIRILTTILFVLIIIACGNKSDVVVVDPGTPAYELGSQLATRISFLNPDSNKIIITTNHFNVSVGEVLDLMTSILGNQTSNLLSYPPKELAEFIRRTAMEHTEKKLLLRVAKKAGMKVTSAELDSIMAMQYQQFGGEAQFYEFLNEREIDVEFFKNDIERGILIDHYLKKILRDRSDVTEEQIQDAYQKFLEDTVATVRHILLLTQEKSDAEKRQIRKKMEGILGRARAGEDFAALATEFTEDPGSKENGGLYENFSRGVMVRPFEIAAFTTPVGEISDIVETRYGYHILKIVERKKNDAPLEEVRSSLAARLRGPKGDDIIPSHIIELKQEANVEIAQFQ